MKQNIYNGVGLLGVGLTVISLRGGLHTGNWAWWIMVIAGFFLLGMSIVEIFFGGKENKK